MILTWIWPTYWFNVLGAGTFLWCWVKSSQHQKLPSRRTLNQKVKFKFELESSSVLISEAYGGRQNVEKNGFRIWIANILVSKLQNFWFANHRFWLLIKSFFSYKEFDVDWTLGKPWLHFISLVQHRIRVWSHSSKSQDIDFFEKLIKLTSLVDQNIKKNF